MKTAHLNVIKGLNLKYLFIKFDSKILQAPQIPIWETFVSKNLPDNCIKTFSLSKHSRALRTTGWFLIRKRLLDLRTHRIIFELRCYEKRWTASKISFFPVEILWRNRSLIRAALKNDWIHIFIQGTISAISFQLRFTTISRDILGDSTIEYVGHVKKSSNLSPTINN